MGLVHGLGPGRGRAGACRAEARPHPRGGPAPRAGLALLQQLRGDLPREPGQPVAAGGAKDHPALRVEDRKLLPGPGDGHIGQAALLLHLLGVVEHPRAREHPLLPAGEEHHRELQPLGGVDRHHHGTVRPLVVVVDVRKQGDLLQKAGEAGLFPGLLLVPAQHGGQLLHVFQPLFGPLRVVLLQIVLIGQALHQLSVQLAGRQLSGPVLLHKFLHQGGEGGRLAGRPGNGREVLGVGEHLEQGLPLLLADLRGQIHGALPNAPAGHVDNAPQADLVGGVVDNAQVGDHVPHLFPVEEPGAANNPVGDALLGEHALQRLGLGVHPVEHGKV